jgi:excisionase family DNA binding protein
LPCLREKKRGIEKMKNFPSPTILPPISAINDLPQKTLLTPAQVASFFNVSKYTIYTWAEIGKLRACNPSGGCLRIFRESVIDLFRESDKLKK